MEMQLIHFRHTTDTIFPLLIKTMMRPQIVAPVLHPMVGDGGFTGFHFKANQQRVSYWYNATANQSFCCIQLRLFPS